MSPKQAIELLDNIAAVFKGDRQTHIQLQVAVGIIRDLVNDTEEKSKEKVSSKEK